MGPGTLKRSQDWSTWVRGVRKRMGCNQRQFAELIGFDPTYISRWENHHWVPAYKGCERLAEQLCMDKWEVLAAAGYTK